MRQELRDLLEDLRCRDPDLVVELHEYYSAEPVAVDPSSRLVKTYEREIESVLHKASHCMVSPGIDDQRFVVLNGGITDCILYGPGVLSLAHAPDEYVPVEDLVNAAKVMAFATMDLLGTA